MRYVSNFLWLIAAGILILGACSKDKTSESFSDLGVEKDKQNIENEGLALIHDLRDLSNTSFAVTSMEMVKMLSSQPLVNRNAFLEAIVGIGDAMGREQSTDQQFEALKSIAYNEGGIFSSIWNEGKGIWVWDPVLNDFERKPGETDEIIYEFPASVESKSNNATIRLYGFKVYTEDFPGRGDIMNDGTVVDEMIQELYFSMHVDGELVATSNIINYFSQDGRFEDIAITFNPLPFSFAADLGRDDNKARWHYKITNGDNVMLEHLLEAIANNDINSDIPLEKVKTNFRIKGIEIVGEVDARQLFTVISETDQMMESGLKLSAEEEKAEMEKLATAINENTDFKLLYVDGGIIAKAHAQAIFKEDSYSYYDFGLDQEVIKTESQWDIGLQFEFSDGSKMNAEVFFEQNFDRFIDELGVFISELEERASMI